MNGIDPVVLGVVGVYLLGMLALGVWAGREKVGDTDDFLVAGRSLPWYMLAATLAATEVGGGSCMGVTQKAFGPWGMGVAWYIWAMAVTFVLIGLLAPVLIRTRCGTVPEYFRQRYGDAAGLVTALLMIVPLVGLTAAQLTATGAVVSAMLGVDAQPAVLISGVVVVLYTFLGGMWSVTLTDFVQWFFVVGGMALAVPFAFHRAGGVDAVLRNLPAGQTSPLAGIGVGTVVSLMILYSASFLVGQEAMQRLYSARDEREARRGAFATAVFYLFFGIIPPLLGLAALALQRQGVLPTEVLTRLGDKAVLPVLAVTCLPPLVTGILFAGLISATMSSADSNLLGAASIWSNDVAPALGIDVEKEKGLRQTRLAVIVAGLAAMAVAALDLKDLVAILVFSFSLRAAGPFFPFVLGHFWERGSRAGALASLAGGTLVVVALQGMGWRPWGLDPVLPGLLTGLGLYLGGSLALPDPVEEPA